MAIERWAQRIKTNRLIAGACMLFIHRWRELALVCSVFSFHLLRLLTYSEELVKMPRKFDSFGYRLFNLHAFRHRNRRFYVIIFKLLELAIAIATMWLQFDLAWLPWVMSMLWFYGINVHILWEVSTWGSGGPKHHFDGGTQFESFTVV